MPTPHKPTARRQPIASVPLIAHVIDGQLDEQLDRWRSGSLTVAQRQEVEWLRGQLAHTRDVDAAILSFAANLMATTIDAILARSDIELGLDAFTDRSPFSHGTRPGR